MRKVFYFGAGPAILPESVLKGIQREFLDYQGTGLSIVEFSHRSKELLAVRDRAEGLLRELLRIPDNYAVLFMHGGATNQFSMLPLNFLGKDASADYLCTGHWSTKACMEAKKFGVINEIHALNSDGSLSILSPDVRRFTSNTAYVHYCDNETIDGVAFAQVPNVDGRPLVCDMTSSILMRPIDVGEYSLIYASTQKNLGIAGLGVVIVKRAFLNNRNMDVPRLYDYGLYAEEDSLVNTPPTFAIYVLQRILDWVKSQGGVEEMYQRSKTRAALVYQVVDAEDLYSNEVAEENRSRINIPFRIKDAGLQDDFLWQAEENRLLGLRGHKAVGGVRVSLYNAMPQAGVQQLISFMQKFARKQLA